MPPLETTTTPPATFTPPIIPVGGSHFRHPQYHRHRQRHHHPHHPHHPVLVYLVWSPKKKMLYVSSQHIRNNTIYHNHYRIKTENVINIDHDQIASVGVE